MPHTENILVSPETHFSRSTRREVNIPAKRFTPMKIQGKNLITTDGRFLVVLNHIPATSISVVALFGRNLTDEYYWSAVHASVEFCDRDSIGREDTDTH